MSRKKYFIMGEDAVCIAQIQIIVTYEIELNHISISISLYLKLSLNVLHAYYFRFSFSLCEFDPYSLLSLYRQLQTIQSN